MKQLQVNFRCKPDLKKKLEALAEEQGRSLSNLIVQLLNRAVKEE